VSEIVSTSIWTAVFATVIWLGACSLFERKEPKIVNPPAPGISYRFHENVQEVMPRAESYCAQWHKKAMLTKTTPQDTDNIAQFDCT
jgi:hypothetical protein